MKRPALFYAGPLLLLLACVALPLARGTETLYLRDVLNTHLEMKWAQAEALRQGYLPILDPYRAGGQPLAGNPNAVPFYPTNLLYLTASTFWALNAHFWIHLLLAPFAFYWLARCWGLRREAAWAAAACYALSGFYLSHLSFYNLIAGATLAPALVAACLRFAGLDPRRGDEPVEIEPGPHPPSSARSIFAPVIALLWGLLLLGGDPLMAALALLLAAAALLFIWRRRGWPGWGTLALLAAAFFCGSLLALPQIVEFLRILPGSFRGHWGYTQQVATVASWDPRQLAEWLLPFLFGRPDVLGAGSFWGSHYFTDTPPYYLSLYPGLLVLALVVASGRPRARAAGWAWSGIIFGLFFALGRFNPVVNGLFGLGGQGSLRYPVKFWLPLAVGGALLCGLGFERLLEPSPEESEATEDAVGDARRAAGERARRRFRLTLLVLALTLGLLWVLLTFFTGFAEGWLRQILPASKPHVFLVNERLRWAGLCLASLLLLSIYGMLARSLRRRPRARPLVGALFLVAHAGAQLLLLRPLYPTDAVAPYLVPPPALAYLPESETAVNTDFNYLFGPSNLESGNYPVPRALWLERRAFYELYPFTGPMWRRRYELNTGPEGLDTFLTRMAQGALKPSDSEKRFRLLAAWGVGRLLIDRPVVPAPTRGRLLARIPSFGLGFYVYEVMDRAPEVFLANRIVPAATMNSAYTLLTDPGFNPRTDVVLPGSGSPRPTGGGSAQVVRRGPESLEVEVNAGAGGSVLVVQRAMSLYRATVDGKRGRIETANLHRIGVPVPAGRHRVRLDIDRAPLNRSLVGVAFGLLALPLLALGSEIERRRADRAIPAAAAASPSPRR